MELHVCQSFFDDDNCTDHMLIPSLPPVPHSVAKFAVQQLAHADYTIATRLSEAAAHVVPWALDHHMYALANTTLWVLQSCDEFGSILICVVVWLVRHTH